MSDATALRLPPEDTDPTDPTPVPKLTIGIVAPPGGPSVSGSQPGFTVELNGTYQSSHMSDISAWVVVDGHSYPSTLTATTTPKRWRATVRLYHVGAVTATAHITGTTFDGDVLNDHSGALTLNVALASTEPDVAIAIPAAGTVINVSEAGELIALRAVSSDQFGPRTVTWDCEGRSGGSAQNPARPSEFDGQVRLDSLPLGSRTIVARCRDAGGNVSTASIVVTAKDVTPPALEIFEPQPFQPYIGGSGGVTVRVTGRSSDGQSGMAGGQSRVAWTLTGGEPFTTAAQVDGWNSWRADVPITDFGTFSIDVRATDRDGSSRTVRVPVQVVSSYRPRDLEERLDARSYLAALLGFARDHVRVAGGGALSSADLQTIFLQPFGKLSQPLSEIGSVGDRPVNQLEQVAEVLREHRQAGARALVAHWTFDAGTVSGAQIADRSGAGNVGTLAGAQIEPGIGGGQAVRFDGASRVEIPNSPSLEVGAGDSDFSVSFFIKPLQAATGDWRSVMHKGANQDGWRTFALWLHPGSMRLHARISTTADPNEGLDSQAELAVDRWTHVAYVRAGSELRLYLDGSLDQLATLSAPVMSNAGPLWLGRDVAFNGFDGLLDDVRIYTLALDLDNVRVLAAAPKSPAPAESLAAGEAAYRWAAYEAFLSGIGTTFEELRLAQGTDGAARASLAERLGIRLTPGPDDEIAQLTVAPLALTEELLEQLFGLRDTDVARDRLRPSTTSLLLQWRRSALALRWAEVDHGADAPERSFPVLIDPDVISTGDLSPAAVGSAARTLLAARVAEVQSIVDGLRAKRESESTPASGLKALLDDVLPGVDLTALLGRQATGEDIGPDLRATSLSRETLSHLVRMTHLAATGTVTDAEWRDTYDVLAQIVKLRRFAQWRQQESPLILSDEHFQVADVSPVLNRWRASRRVRTDWQTLLQARIEERAALEASYEALISSVAESALPLLRNALVGAFAGVDVADASATWLTDRLQIDVAAGGTLVTTRIMQAAETLQSLLFALRTGQLSESHPADDWTITSESSFDDAWRWLGTHEAWRAAMYVFLYPENLLLPALRLDATQPFASLLRELRQRQRISPSDARVLAASYLAPQLSRLYAGNLPAPLASWSFEEGSGASAADGSGGGSQGALSGALWTSGAIGRGLTFDGVDDSVVVTPSQALKDVRNTFTVSFWARPQSPHEIDPESTSGAPGTTGQRYVIGPLQAEATFGAARAGMGVSVGTNGISVYEHGNGYLPSVLTYEAPIVGWTHVAVVYEDRKPRLYVDGRLVRSRDVQSPKTSVHACPDGLGGMGYGWFHGQLDEVRIDSSALNADQISLLAFRLSDERTDVQLQDLRALNQRLLAPLASAAPPYLSPAAAWLTELLYQVPLALAQQLQASGEYVAALDWFQTVYAHSAPPQRRKVYYGLAVERSQPTNLEPKGNWTAALNPHAVASRRPNPYTRYVLLGLARCCMDFADAEFTRDTSDALARARALYDTARDLLGSSDLEPVVDIKAAEWPLPNPVHAAMRARVAVQLAKLRQGRNIAGVQRVLELPSRVPTPGASTPSGGLPAPPQQLRPTPYRYRVLVERAKQLVALAQQVEAAYLSALEKHDAGAYQRFEAEKGVELAEAGVVLQGLRVTEARDGLGLAQAQRRRADVVADEYKQLIEAGLNEYEDAMLAGYWQIKTLRDVMGALDAAIGIAQMAMQAGTFMDFIGSLGFKQGAAATASVGMIGKAVTGGFLNNAEARLQSNALLASHERLVEGWQLQRSFAQQDALIADAQISIAKDQQAIVAQEQRIAQTQARQAKSTVEFLDRQFTNQELYDWMSGVLAGVYRYFLQQATALARMAQDQLAFERAESAAGLIRADYWEPPAETVTNGATVSRDRRGLTGSTRLLQDVTQLDEYAFETDRRKLNLAQTFSLAERAPLQFQLFRETGVLQFATPMDWFDEDFPGHFLRLVRRVSLSVVALVPPSRGIRATLTSSGISRVVVGSDTFRQVMVRRDPEVVALTSPVGATGIFELDTQSEMLLPFEAMGVDTSWELQLPRAANPFDFDSLGDVLVTIEYTARASDDYRRQVVERLNRAGRRSGDRAFSLRQEFQDEWYELLNPPSTGTERKISLPIAARDFPSNLSDVRVADVILYLARNGDHPVPPVAVTLTHASRGGVAVSDKGVISTRRGNAALWAQVRTAPPDGAWDLTFSAEACELLDDGDVKDVLLVVGYSGAGPRWPA